MKKLLTLGSILLFILLTLLHSNYIAFNKNKPKSIDVKASEIKDSTPESNLNITTTTVEKKSEFDRRLTEYTQKYEEYRKAHDAYVIARAQYLRSKTQKSKTDAKEATTKLLELRDDVVILYLNTLRVRLNETEGVSDVRYEGLAIKLVEEIAWYEEHRNQISSAGTLEDLVDDSNEAKQRQKSTERVYYEVLSNISYGKVSNYRERLKEDLQSLREKVDEIRVDDRDGYSFSNRKIQILDRWMLEADNLVLRTEGKQHEADEVITELVGKKISTKVIQQYNKVIIKLFEGKQFLKEASSYLVEVIKEIKIAEE